MLMEPLNKIINEEIMQHKQKHDTNEVRLAILETSVSHIYKSLERMEKNIEKGFELMEKKFDSMDRKFEGKFNDLNNKIGKVEDRLWQHLYWLLGIFSTLLIGISLTVAKNFHWIGT